MKWKAGHGALVIGLLGLVISACGTSSTTSSKSTTSSNGAASLKGKSVGVVELYANVFWNDAVAGIQKIADPLGIKVQVLNSNGDAATQTTNVTDVISAGVSAAIIGPVAPAGAVADLQRLDKAGITVYCLDSCAPDAQAPQLSLGWVNTNASALGQGVGAAAVNYIKTEMGGSATIAMVECDSLGPVCSDRHTAINQALAQVPNAKVVASQDAFQTADAEPKVVDMLTANPNVNLIITNNQGGTEGAYAAVKQMGLLGKVHIFGIDMTNVIADDLLATPPTLLYSVAQNSYQEGIIAMQNLVDKWEGKGNPKPFHDILAPAPYPASDASAIQQYLSSGLGKS